MTTLAQQFADNGFVLVEDALPQELITRVAQCIDRLAEAPLPAGKGPEMLLKMNTMHLTEAVINELVSHPAIGRLASAITGAEMVQVFATQTLVKPTGGAETANVGWHQDYQYWHKHLQGELLTAWVAVSDVAATSGPMRFVRGSHTWGFLDAGDFFSGNLDALRGKLLARHGGTWDEVPAVLKPGGVSFHHRLTIHGSGANQGPGPRKSVAIHMRTEKSALASGVKFGDVPWLHDFSNHNASPVLYGQEAAKSGNAS